MPGAPPTPSPRARHRGEKGVSLVNNLVLALSLSPQPLCPGRFTMTGGTAAAVGGPGKTWGPPGGGPWAQVCNMIHLEGR